MMGNGQRWAAGVAVGGREGCGEPGHRFGKARQREARPPAEPWEEAKAMLMRDFDIDSAFLRVKTVAKILGVSQALVYAWIREDQFFLPYRMFNSAPAVKLEDLARWYCSSEGGPVSLELATARERSAVAG